VKTEGGWFLLADQFPRHPAPAVFTRAPEW
jgi:hypothetical protein